MSCHCKSWIKVKPEKKRKKKTQLIKRLNEIKTTESHYSLKKKRIKERKKKQYNGMTRSVVWVK